MSFLRRNRNKDAPPPPPTPIVEEITAQEYSLKLAFLARSSDGLRMPADPAMKAMLPSVVEPLAIGQVEILEPADHRAAPRPAAVDRGALDGEPDRAPCPVRARVDRCR
jgi:hypothetical protein